MVPASPAKTAKAALAFARIRYVFRHWLYLIAMDCRRARNVQNSATCCKAQITFFVPFGPLIRGSIHSLSPLRSASVISITIRSTR